MKGSVRRRGNKWEYYYRELHPGTGKWRQRSKAGFASRREAEAALRTVLSTMDAGNYVSPSSLSLGDYLTYRWLPSIKTTIRASTHASYSRIVRLHIVPRLGAVKLQALDPMMLNEFYGALLREGRVDRPGPLSVRSVRYVHAVLHRALRDAMRWQLLTRNVTEAADPPKQNTVMRPLMRTWSAETLREFLTACEGDRKHPAWLLLASTGMRRGEVLGLSWDDVDLETAQLAVRRTLVAVDMEVAFSDPKTQRSRRVVALDATTVAALRSWRRRQLEDKLALGPAYDDQGFVFTRADGRPYDPNDFSREFDRRIKRLGLPRIRLHDLRHTWATLALQAGIHPKVVSERLGHSTIAITLDIYSHVTPTLQREAASIVAATIFGNG